MGFKAVVVDDELLTVEALTKLIPLCCPEIEVTGNAENGKMALELINRLEPDIAVVDINMPVINGIELIKILKEQGSSTKIVVLSAYREFEYAVSALNYGAYAYLLKPISVENVRKTMKELVERIHEERTAKQVQKKYVEILPDFGKNVFLKFISGKLSPEEMKNETLGMQLKLPKEFLAVMLRLLPLEGGMEGSGMAREILNTFRENYILCAERENDEIILMIQAEGAYNQMALLEKELIAGGIPAVIYMGERCRNFQEIWQSLKKVKEAEWFHFYMDFTGKIVKCGELLRHKKERKNFLLDSAVIKRGIREKNRDVILEYLSQCVDSWKKEMDVSPRQIYQAVYELLLLIKAETPITDGSLRYALDNLTVEDLKRYTTLTSLVWYAEGLMIQISAESGSEEGKAESGDKVIVMVKDYCGRHYGEDISLDEVADYVNMSKNYLCNYFKKNTGENFLQYLKKLRVEIAMRKLREGNEKIGEVAMAVGYRNVSHFGKMFKEETGISPAEYRNREFR